MLTAFFLNNLKGFKLLIKFKPFVANLIAFNEPTIASKAYAMPLITLGGKDAINFAQALTTLAITLTNTPKA